MSKKSHDGKPLQSTHGELSLDQLDSVAGGAGQVITDNNSAQMLTDLHLTQPNALQPHNSTNPGIQTDILTGTDVSATTTHDSTSFTATAGARTGVANDTQLSIGNLHSQAGADVDASFKAGATGVSGQAGGHAIASTSLDMGAGFTNNNTARADGDVFLKAGIGASAGVEGGVRASTNITQSNNIDVGHDTHVFNSTVYEAGGKAEAGAQARLSPLDGNLTVGANAFAGGYVSLGETVGVDSHGVTATAGGAVITPGSAGVGFAPLIGEQDGKYNLGIHVAVAAGIGGVTFDGNISLDKDMVNHGVMTGVNAVANTATNIYHDPVVQFVGGVAAQAGQQLGSDIAHGATDTAHTVTHGATNAANTVAHGATDAAHTVGHGITGAAHTVAHGVTDAAHTVAHGVTGAVHTVGHGITGAAHTVAHGATDAAHTVAHGVTGAVHTVEHGITGAAHTVAHGVTDTAHTVAHGATNAAHTVAHGASGAAHTVAHGVTGAAHTVAHGVTDTAHTVAHGATNAAHTVAHGASGAAHTVAHGITNAAHSVGNAFSSAGHAIAHVFCHAAGTLIAMADGSTKRVEQLKMGDETLLGGQVLGRGEVLASDLYSYRGTTLNGRHAVFEDGRWVRVENSSLATRLDVPPATVYPVVTANHLLVCEQYICADLAEMDNDIGAVGRLAALNADAERNLELRRAEERFGFSRQRAA
ncbi:hypothetical protein [Leptospira sp. severe_002]|uniref:hypothetical protein n=1 Tax=Leptospira sp. severe_002 TaxID=2838237 RepID=UPI001E54B7C6|nr:hypothetical protein [Leptospira sp. severe_002]